MIVEEPVVTDVAPNWRELVTNLMLDVEFSTFVMFQRGLAVSGNNPYGEAHLYFPGSEKLVLWWRLNEQLRDVLVDMIAAEELFIWPAGPAHYWNQGFETQVKIAVCVNPPEPQWVPSVLSIVACPFKKQSL